MLSIATPWTPEGIANRYIQPNDYSFFAILFYSMTVGIIITQFTQCIWEEALRCQYNPNPNESQQQNYDCECFLIPPHCSHFC